MKSAMNKDKPKVLLINPPQRYVAKALGFNVYFPLSLLYISAMVKDLCAIRILDCLVTDFEITESGGFCLYGTSFDNIKNAIADFSPDVVGITIPFTTQSKNAKQISRICRQIDPDIKVVFGGPHASVKYEQLLAEDLCDYCVIGEGELTFKEFMEKLTSRSNLFDIEGLAYKKNGKIEYMSRKPLDDLDELPFPAYDLINADDYLNSPYLYKSRSSIPGKSISMITSRGCPFNCVFCSIMLHMGKKYRYHSSDYVIRHLRYCIEELGISSFHFEDDNVSFKGHRFEALLDKIIKNKLDIRWDTPNGIRADTLNYRILEKIKKTGCVGLQIAIESGNQRVLDEVIKKDTSLEDVLKIVEQCAELKIKLCAFYVIGFPGETLAEIKDTVALALRLFKTYNVVPIMLFATPLYGTELYQTCVEMGIIDETLSDEDFATATMYYGEPLIFTKEFSKQDLKRLTREFESKINSLVGKDSLRDILNDKQTFFARME